MRNLKSDPELVQTLKDAYKGNVGGIWSVFKNNKLNIVLLVKKCLSLKVLKRPKTGATRMYLRISRKDR